MFMLNTTQRIIPEKLKEHTLLYEQLQKLETSAHVTGDESVLAEIIDKHTSSADVYSTQGRVELFCRIYNDYNDIVYGRDYFMDTF